MVDSIKPIHCPDCIGTHPHWVQYNNVSNRLYVLVFCANPKCNRKKHIKKFVLGSQWEDEKDAFVARELFDDR